jgi:hypothetical protein
MDDLGCLFYGRLEPALCRDCCTPSLSGRGRNSRIVGRRIKGDIQVCFKLVITNELLASFGSAYLSCLISKTIHFYAREEQILWGRSIRRC